MKIDELCFLLIFIYLGWWIAEITQWSESYPAAAFVPDTNNQIWLKPLLHTSGITSLRCSCILKQSVPDYYKDKEKQMESVRDNIHGEHTCLHDTHCWQARVQSLNHDYSLNLTTEQLETWLYHTLLYHSNLRKY